MTTYKHPATKEDFVNRVMSAIQLLEPADEVAVRAGTGQLYDDGFTVYQAIRYTCCMEEVNPTLPEEDALKAMTAIRAEVQKAKPKPPVEADRQPSIKSTAKCQHCRWDRIATSEPDSAISIDEVYRLSKSHANREDHDVIIVTLVRPDGK